MRLYFKQRFFSWFDSYDIYDESGNAVYEVKGQLAWGHCLKIFGADGNELGTVKERVLSLLPRFELYIKDSYIGCITKEFTFFKPKFQLDCNGWNVEGNWMEWDYSIVDSAGMVVANVTKELFNWTDTYVIDIEEPQNALGALMVVLAIDAEKCSRNHS